ncbi:MAG: aromatic amino acid transport family protein [Lawsonibacter sp.]|jgi:amino acid permease
MAKNQDTVVQGNFETEEGALKVKKLTPYEAAFMIIGVNIGSGILSLAYSSRLGGWPILALWLVVSAVIVTVSMLYVAEVALRTKKVMQLPGLAERYLGKTGSVLIFIGVCINSLSCLIAYTSGSGSIIASFLGCSDAIGGVIFSIPAILVVFFGLKSTGVAQKVISTAMIVLLACLVIATFINENTDVSRAMYSNWSFALPLLNMAVFCHITQYAVPDIVRGLRDRPKMICPSIVGAKVVVTLFLCLVPLSVLAITGPENVTQVATIAWGNALGPVAAVAANLFALTAMLTSYWTHCSSMLNNIIDIFKFKDEDDKKTRVGTMIFVAGIPFLLAYSGLVGFVDAISLAGAFGGIIMSVLPIFMLNAARKTGDNEPPWKCGWYSAKWMQALIIVVFIFSTGYKILSMFGLLPVGW